MRESQTQRVACDLQHGQDAQVNGCTSRSVSHKDNHRANERPARCREFVRGRLARLSRYGVTTMHDHQSFIAQSAHAAESSTSSQTHDGSGFLIMLLLLYFIPAIIAFRRRHHNRTAITALNVLLGWSVIGWIAAFVWALTAVTVQANANGP
ncbi:hypothetical protein BCO71171_05976 [Burkholderia contaminans]|uniref:Superinfection immunity protein n=2 Tax=Burkholderiaceae TaxID=119060 RepID=A0A6P3BMR9_9BURK|nr:hypothetical protein BCO71171_05976 [Burkholderia contaminans]